MARRIPKGAKPRIFLSVIIFSLIMVYFLFTLGYYGVKLISLRNEQNDLSNNLIDLQFEEKELKNEIEKLKDPEYLARYAREHFFYSKDGEYIIRLENEKEENIFEEPVLILTEDWYIYVISGLSIFIILFILYIFKKNKRKTRKNN